MAFKERVRVWVGCILFKAQRVCRVTTILMFQKFVVGKFSPIIINFRHDGDFSQMPKILISYDVELKVFLCHYSMENTDDDELWNSKVDVLCA